MGYLKEIANRLNSLNDIENVEVKLSSTKKTINIKYPTQRSLNFKFTWSENHFIGYFMDNDGDQSQAVISLWKPIDAIHFVTAYSLLVELRAGRRSSLS